MPKALTLPLLEKINCARRFKGSLISRGFVLRPEDQSSSCARFPCLFPRCLSSILLETFSEAPLKLNARRSRCAAHLHIRINYRPCGGRSMRLEMSTTPKKILDRGIGSARRFYAHRPIEWVEFTQMALIKPICGILPTLFNDDPYYLLCPARYLSAKQTFP